MLCYDKVDRLVDLQGRRGGGLRSRWARGRRPLDEPVAVAVGPAGQRRLVLDRHHAALMEDPASRAVLGDIEAHDEAEAALEESYAQRVDLDDELRRLAGELERVQA